MKGEAYLERLYGQAGRDLRSMLLGIDLSKFDSEKADDIRRKTRRLVAVLNLGAEKWTNTALRDAYDIGARRAKVALETLGQKPGSMKVKTSKWIVDDTFETLIRSNRSISKIIDRYLEVALVAAHKLRTTSVQEFTYAQASDILDELAKEAVMLEETRGWLKKKIADYLHEIIEADEFIEINGRMYRMKKYAELVARTTLRDAQTKATLDLCRQYENDLVQVSDHACDCEICEEYEGKIYSLSGMSTEYERLPDEPPFHPNCKHSLLPTSEEAIEARGIFG